MTVPGRMSGVRLAFMLLGGAALVMALLYGAYRAELLPVRVIARSYFSHTATLLPDGDVLVFRENEQTFERYDSARDRWQRVGPLPQELFGLSATLLTDGRVLVIGDILRGPTFSQVYDPATGQWSATPEFSVARYLHTATLLHDGTVLVVGGDPYNGDAAAASRYDPVNNRWLPTARMLARHSSNTATLLADGRVLVIEGKNAEVYDPAEDSWRKVAGLNVQRGQFTATLLADGRVLVTGGDDAATAEIYDPAADSWHSTAPLATARYGATATLLSDGTVLVAGGQSADRFAKPIRFKNAERYDPAAERWSAAGQLAYGRYRHTATLLPDGEVLVVDGNDPERAASAERYTTGNGRWRNASGITIAPIAAFMGVATLLFGCYALVALSATVLNETRFGGWWFQQMERGRYELPLPARAKVGLLALHAGNVFQWAMFAVLMLREASLWPFEDDRPVIPLLVCCFVPRIALMLVVRANRGALRPTATKQPALP